MANSSLPVLAVALELGRPTATCVPISPCRKRFLGVVFSSEQVLWKIVCLSLMLADYSYAYANIPCQRPLLFTLSPEMPI